MKLFFVTSILFFLIVFAFAVFALARATEREKVANYLNLPASNISIECPQNTYEIMEDSTLKVCLNKTDHKKRCEIAIDTLAYNQDNKVSFSFRLSEDIQSWKNFYGIMQIHGYPDYRESWRCPPFSLDIKNSHLSLFNRWDAAPLSFTTGTNCTEPGSTIQNRVLLKDHKIKPNHWYDFSLTPYLSYESDGATNFSFAGETGTVQGPNVFNDKRPPYLKLGIYKPTPWSPQQEKICVEYRDIQISQHK